MESSASCRKRLRKMARAQMWIDHVNTLPCGSEIRSAERADFRQPRILGRALRARLQDVTEHPRLFVMIVRSLALAVPDDAVPSMSGDQYSRVRSPIPGS